MVVNYVDPQIKLAESKQEQEQCLQVRIKVFVDEQKYPLETETDEYVLLPRVTF